MLTSLSVHIGKQLAGQLSYTGGVLSFQYDKNYLASKAPLPLSRHLPLQAAPFEDRATRAFFANLLPEGGIRTQVARQVGVSPDNIFGLLEAIGGDCAGALSLLPEDSALVHADSYRPIGDDLLVSELETLPAHPLLAGEDGIRLSLAGAQNKLPIYWDKKGYALPEGGSPSTHILKTAIPQLQHSVINEVFCMNLASRVGLNVPKAEVATIGSQQVYRVERYDRKLGSNGAIERLHQEDFCQALGIPPELKYENEGGPGFKDCFQLVEEWSDEPLLDTQQLLNWALFNFIIGNADAHGKNLSFLYADGMVRLAPFYDLISTAVYERINNKFAMKMGGEKDPRYLQASNLKHFAEEIGIDIRTVRNAIKRMADNVAKQSVLLAQEYKTMAPEILTIINAILKIIQQRSAKARVLTNAPISL